MDTTIEWLLDGDPAVRWQTLRDLCDAPEAEWHAERWQTGESGWGAQILASLGPDGLWPDGRWTGSVWTLCTLVDLGLPGVSPLAAAAQRLLNRNLPRPIARVDLLAGADLCHLGFWLRIGATYTPADPRLPDLAATILSVQLADGGWNCRIRRLPGTIHSSFHTTFNVLDGLAAAADAGVVDRQAFQTTEARALEFMLQHQLYRSDRTGAVVNERFTYLTYPSYWHYTVLRGLDYLAARPQIADDRLADPIALIESRRNARGRWPVEKRISGDTLFDMERMGADSRWNTLRALRVLKRRAALTA